MYIKCSDETQPNPKKRSNWIHQYFGRQNLKLEKKVQSVMRCVYNLDRLNVTCN